MDHPDLPYSAEAVYEPQEFAAMHCFPTERFAECSRTWILVLYKRGPSPSQVARSIELEHPQHVPIWLRFHDRPLDVPTMGLSSDCTLALEGGGLQLALARPGSVARPPFFCLLVSMHASREWLRGEPDARRYAGWVNRLRHLHARAYLPSCVSFHPTNLSRRLLRSRDCLPHGLHGTAALP